MGYIEDVELKKAMQKRFSHYDPDWNCKLRMQVIEEDDVITLYVKMPPGDENESVSDVRVQMNRENVLHMIKYLASVAEYID